MSATLLELTERGLYCPAGDFFIDPWRPVPRAVVTHAHSDHARWGCQRYLAVSDGLELLRMRLGPEASIDTLAYGESTQWRGVDISLHPAGHMLGASQVRIEVGGQVAVVTGDYKLEADPTCRQWEPVRCHLLVTETTFGLPVYRWPAPQQVAKEINAWWRDNADAGRCSVLYGYAIGKSQRLLSLLDPNIGPIYTHGAVERGVEAYRRSGVALPMTTPVAATGKGQSFAGCMVLAVPSAHGTHWLRRFGDLQTAMASGWMMVRGQRRRRSMDRGFVLSDHVDWPSLLTAVNQCQAEEVWATHGYSRVVARYFNEQGLKSSALATRLRDEHEDSGEEVEGES